MADYWEVEEPTPDNSRFRLFRSGTAVKFEAPKASFITALSAPHGLVSPGESVEIQATLAANADMIAGPSFNKLAILTNDPAPAYGSVRFDAVIAGDALVAEAALEKDDIDFGRVFRTSQLLVPVTVKNTGHDAMTITGISVTGGSPETDAKLGTVEAGMSKDIVLTIPTANEGPVDYEVTIGTTAGTLTADHRSADRSEGGAREMCDGAYAGTSGGPDGYGGGGIHLRRRRGRDCLHGMEPETA